MGKNKRTSRIRTDEGWEEDGGKGEDGNMRNKRGGKVKTAKER
jgi:hypothetical protein